MSESRYSKCLQCGKEIDLWGSFYQDGEKITLPDLEEYDDYYDYNTEVELPCCGCKVTLIPTLTWNVYYE